MSMRIIGIFIFMGVIAITSSKLFGINILDLIILALVLSPFVILQANLREHRAIIANSGSIIFNEYKWVFQLCSTAFAIIILIGLYKFGQVNGLGLTIIYLITALIIQSPYYAFIKLTMPGEIFLIPLEIAGLFLFYSHVL